MVSQDKTFGGWFCKEGEWEFVTLHGDEVDTNYFLQGLLKRRGGVAFTFVCGTALSDRQVYDLFQRTKYIFETGPRWLRRLKRFCRWFKWRIRSGPFWPMGGT